MPQTVNNLPEVQEAQVRYLGWEDSMEKGMVTYSSILPKEFHGQRSLAGYSSWCPIELDMTELLRLSLFFFFSPRKLTGCSRQRKQHVQRTWWWVGVWSIQGIERRPVRLSCEGQPEVWTERKWRVA